LQQTTKKTRKVCDFPEALRHNLDFARNSFKKDRRPIFSPGGEISIGGGPLAFFEEKGTGKARSGCRGEGESAGLGWGEGERKVM